MKMASLIFLFILICKSLVAPPSGSLHIFVAEPIKPYEALIKAVVMVESANGKYLYNPDEDAVGWFQIRQIRVDDYNKRLGTNYVLTDFYDYELSRTMFLYYASGKSFEVAAKSWNGSGPMTNDYWKKVKTKLNAI